ncbi:MAG: PLDc N-terminal domain-containing protein [Myxococcales bacterium]|nr:PLDc N-terminal domain-containing protein [Myxococcales bacterium]
MDEETTTLLQLALAILALASAVLVTLHALATRSEPRSTLSWIALAWLSPFIGVILYLLLGINRIRRRVLAMRDAVPAEHRRSSEFAVSAEDVGDLSPLARAIGAISRRPLVGGNAVEALADGDQAYPAMLAAIRAAERTIAFQTYIFELAGPGEDFVLALSDAVARGVEVRVLVDAAGERYGTPAITKALARRGVKARRFMPAFPPWRWPYANLRNHRKVLVVDGRVGFAGGLNIRPDHVLGGEPRSPTRDYHFRFEGPVARQLGEAFAEDWLFATGEHFEHAYEAEEHEAGEARCRVVTDGPDDDLDRAWNAMFAALGEARHRIAVVTPYFLPDAPLVAALETAARRGVRVDVVVPAQGNLRFVDWATQHLLDRSLQNVHVWRTPPPFDHAKLLVVDGAWSFVGSPNWDPRSLRLNFEIGVEVYDEGLARTLEAAVDARIASARPHAQETRVLPRYRNAALFLGQPFL